VTQEAAHEPKPHIGLDEDGQRRLLDTLRDAPEQLPPLLDPLHPADVADVLESLPRHERRTLVEHLASEVLGDVLAELGEGVRDDVLSTMTPREVAAAVEELDSDDKADIVQELEDEQQLAVQRLLRDRDAKKLATYAPDTAGGLMQTEVFVTRRNATVSDVLKQIRRQSDDLPENIGTIFVTTSKNELVGTIAIPRLVKLSLKAKIGDVMRSEPLRLTPETPQNEVVEVFEKYDIHNCAVVDEKNRLLGRIAIDDVLDVILEERAREAYRAAGLDETEDLFAPLHETARHRLPWLILNLFTAILASVVIALFDDAIAQLVALAVLMPIVASMGGNAATQTLTVTVRALATKQINAKNMFYLLRKEVLVGSLNGLLLALALAAGTGLLYQNWVLAGVILTATLANHLFAALAGYLIPLLLKRLNKDPAISAGVLVTTVTDVGGFFVFLGLGAYLLL
jgi:magnesium transporter